MGILLLSTLKITTNTIQSWKNMYGNECGMTPASTFHMSLKITEEAPFIHPTWQQKEWQIVQQYIRKYKYEL